MSITWHARVRQRGKLHSASIQSIKVGIDHGAVQGTAVNVDGAAVIVRRTEQLAVLRDIARGRVAVSLPGAPLVGLHVVRIHLKRQNLVGSSLGGTTHQEEGSTCVGHHRLAVDNTGRRVRLRKNLPGIAG